MGAESFITYARGDTAEEAFRAAVSEAQWDYGHSGYSGTIAEKDGFVMIALPTGEDPCDFAFALINNDDSRIGDKWGPAGCIDLGKGKYLFFGWASS